MRMIIQHKNRNGISSIFMALTVVVVAAICCASWYVYSMQPIQGSLQNTIATFFTGTATIKGTLESTQSSVPDQGIIYTIKAGNGIVWSAENCGNANLPSPIVDNAANGDNVIAYGKLDKQRAHTIDLCGSRNYFIKRL